MLEKVFKTTLICATNTADATRKIRHELSEGLEVDGKLFLKHRNTITRFRQDVTVIATREDHDNHLWAVLVTTELGHVLSHGIFTECYDDEDSANETQ